MVVPVATEDDDAVKIELHGMENTFFLGSCTLSLLIENGEHLYRIAESRRAYQSRDEQKFFHAQIGHFSVQN